ncbi:YtxH domain-containing protein [Janibacter melonis]|uniref:YtxH domain-containing protein n=1 Tax=Janibacter melonis TaxID=262209 RepID=UPI0020446576|nr:YtxH domain-containing protein [Janibacter melonis]MCM3553527.1 YtxH domain-containing protein [Janibacter melonis]
MARISFLAGVGVGYVLGARAGRQRYEQIKTQASQLWSSPKVQRTVDQAKDTAKTQAPVVADKVTGAAKDAAGTVKDKAGSAHLPGRGEDLPDTIHRGDDGQLHADTSGFGPGGDKLP